MSMSRTLALVVSSLFAPLTAQVPSGLTSAVFLGGSGFDAVDAWDQIASAPNGDVLVCGRTASGDFPHTSGLGPLGFEDGFVARYDRTGQRLWVVQIGGTGRDDVRALAVEANGDVVIAGRTSSVDFPTTPGALQRTHRGGAADVGDGFVARLTNAVSGPPSLSWSTYLGGTSNDTVLTLCVHPNGLVIAGGWTASLDFPTAGQPFQVSHAPQTCGTIGSDGFIAVLDPSAQGGLQLRAATYLGGRCDDMVHDVEILQGEVVAAGRTGSPDFWTTSSGYDRTLGGAQDAFVVVVDPALTTLGYGTFLGGSGDEQLHGMAITPAGEIVLGGQTASLDFPTTPGALQTAFLGGGYFGIDGFLARLDPARTGAAQLTWGTFLGGTGWDAVMHVAVDRAGLVTAVGAVNSSDFATTPGAYDRTFDGGGGLPEGPFDGFVCHLHPDATGAAQLVYATYLGGAQAGDNVTGVAMFGGTAHLVGWTRSADFPATGPFGGDSEVFVAALDLLPTGVERLPAVSAVSVNSMPVAGNLGFEIWVHGSLQGALLGIPNRAGTSVPFLGGAVFLQLSSPLIFLPVVPGPFLNRVPLPVPLTLPRGVQVACQGFYPSVGCNLICPPFYATGAVIITVQ